MKFEAIKDELFRIVDIKNVKFDEPMKNHTSFKVGGPVDIFTAPQSESEIQELIKFFKRNNIPVLIIGNGSNLLIRDKGIRGAVICLTGLKNTYAKGTKVYAEGGAVLSAVANEALKNSLKGLEFASGIPGTVGGAVTMNAGAYGPEIKDIIDSARVMDMEGNIFNLMKDELELSYRNSIIQKNNYIVLQAVFNLDIGNSIDIKNRMDELNKRRSDKQPLNFPSAGSTFKRPEGYFASKLIDDCGLKGFSVGGAMVSEKHSGFIINYNNSTSKDILELINRVTEIVNEKYNVKIEPEVKIIGEE